jgi:hypothetical protein
MYFRIYSLSPILLYIYALPTFASLITWYQHMISFFFIKNLHATNSPHVRPTVGLVAAAVHYFGAVAGAGRGVSGFGRRRGSRTRIVD